jgi:ribose 5-phosphate isomerase B
MRIAVGSDHAGFELKGKIISHLGGLGHEILDVGTESHRVGRKVADGSAERGVVVCGTGIGACMAVNKVGGIRGALVWNEENARLAGAHNNANVLCLGGRTMDHELALKMIDIWLETPFEGGRHERRIEQIEDLGAL